MVRLAVCISFLFTGVAVSAASPVCPVVDATKEEVRDTVVLQEFNVTSIKQSDKLFNMPEAATVIGREEAERLNAVAIKSLSDVVPNVFIPDYGSRITSSIYVRGIGARMDQPSVGLNVDNVPVLNKDAYDFDVADIAGVEMLRGPQTALYGRNTMAGQINITTLSPFRFQGWRLRAEFSSPVNAKASAGWYGRLGTRHGLSVTGAYTYSRGYFKNSFNGKMVDPERMWSVRTKYIWRISDALTLQNVLASSSLHQGGYAYENVESGQIAFNDTCFYRRFLLNDGLTLRWNTDLFSLSSITSVQHIDDNMTLDQDFLPLDYFTLTQKKKETAFTQDIVVRSKPDGSMYSWLAGAFGFYKHLGMQAPVSFHDYGISELIEKHRNENNPSHPISWDTRDFTLHSDFTIPVFGLSLYHQSDLSLGRWKLSLGLRLDYEYARMHYRSRCGTGYLIYDRGENGVFVSGRHVDVDIDDSGRLSDSYLNFIPKFTALYELPTADPSNIYVNIAKGYKSGGFNTQMFSDVLQQRLMGIMGICASYEVDEMVSYKPEYSWNFEAGAHLGFCDSRLTADISLFYIDCRDQQLTMFPDGTTTGRMMTNAGKTRSFGIEVAAAYAISDNLRITGSYGYTNAKFREFSDGHEDFSGRYIPYAPQNTLFLQAVYSVPLNHKVFNNLEFDANLRGTGKIYWNEANTLHQDFYCLPGCSVALEAEKWQLRLFGTNLSDTRYHTFYFQSIGNEFLQRGKPWQIGLALTAQI